MAIDGRGMFLTCKYVIHATLIRAADRWCRVSISDLERHQLKLLRAELGLDPPPANTDNRKTNRRKDIAA